jgi:hypothetical protein
MYAPGQNRDDTSSIVPSSEPDCAGGNIPGSGALPQRVTTAPSATSTA